MMPSMGFSPLGRNTLSTFNQPTTNLGPLMRRQRRGTSKKLQLSYDLYLFLFRFITYLRHITTTEMAPYRNILRADLIETLTGYEVHCGNTIEIIHF